MTVILFNLKGNIKMKKTVKNLCLFVSCLTMFMAIHPGKAGADSCGSENDGYVCCNSYHTFGHGNYLTTINGTAKGSRYINIDSGFNNTQETTINNIINTWNSQLSSNASSIFYLIKQQANYQIKIQSGKLENSITGYTRFYNKTGGEISLINNLYLSSEYSNSIIYIDPSKGYLKKTVAHELGHAMGLSHRSCNPNSIMYNYVGTVNVDTPQLIDSRTIYHIYSR